MHFICMLLMKDNSFTAKYPSYYDGYFFIFLNYDCIRKMSAILFLLPVELCQANEM